MIRIGLPKGRLAGETAALCGALGIVLRPGGLSYRAVAGGRAVSVLLLKSPDVARLLAGGVLDLGVAGDEWLLETGIPSGCRCLATRSYEASVCLLTAAGDARPAAALRSVVTPYPRLARQLLRGVASAARVVAVSGSSEALVPDVADACVDLVETGASAAANGLAVRRSFCRVTTHLTRSPKAEPKAVAPVVAMLAGSLAAAS